MVKTASNQATEIENFIVSQARAEGSVKVDGYTLARGWPNQSNPRQWDAERIEEMARRNRLRIFHGGNRDVIFEVDVGVKTRVYQN